jgi:hypothetical protein
MAGGWRIGRFHFGALPPATTAVNVQETTPAMSFIEPGGIDCNIHPAVPNLKALLPYLSDHWRDIVVQRGVYELESIAYLDDRRGACR